MSDRRYEDLVDRVRAVAGGVRNGLAVGPRNRTITLALVRARYRPRRASRQERGAWMTGFLDRVAAISASPYRAANRATFGAWLAGWTRAEELLAAGYCVVCADCRKPLDLSERASTFRPLVLPQWPERRGAR